MFLIAMISLTMSRISSRAEFGVELGELAEVDRLDQRAEDRPLDLVVGVRAARIDGGRDLLRRFAARRRVSPTGSPGSARPGRRTGTACGRLRRRRLAGAARRCRRGRRRRRSLGDGGGIVGKWDACQTRTQLQLGFVLTAAAVSRSAATAGPSVASSAPRARSIAAPAGGTVRRCGGSTIFPRSSGRCSPPRRTVAARTG